MDLTAIRPTQDSSPADSAADSTTAVSTTAGLHEAVHELAPRLLRFARGRSAGHEAPLAEEAAQDALAALVDCWRRHGAPQSPEAFAFAVLRRRLARAQARRALTRPLEALRDRFGSADSSCDPAHRIGARDELREVRRGLERLSPKLRDALLLVAAGEQPMRDAAGVLGISLSALKMRVSRAREQLRQETEQEKQA